MDKASVFMLLCICHLLGDYFLQSEETAQKKMDDLAYYGKHIVQYAVPFTILLFVERLCMGVWHWNWYVLSVGTHMGIDFVKRCYETQIRKKDKQIEAKTIECYVVDQAAHFASILLVAICCPVQFTDESGYLTKVIPYLLYFLSLLKPANVTFKILFSQFQVTTNAKEEEKTDMPKTGAGAWIGNLERLLSGVLILLGQFSAVGLTMTAKSIARYDEIVKNPAFAEYYLIGTLYSILYTISVYCLIFKLIL